MRKPIILLSLYFIGSFGLAMANNERSSRITFEDAVTRALEQSYDLQRAYVDVLSAMTDRLKTLAQMGPTGRGTFSQTVNAREISIPNVGIVQPLQTQQAGIRVGANLTAVVAGLVKVWSQTTSIRLTEKAKESLAIETSFAVAEIYRQAQHAQAALVVAKTRLETFAKQQRDATYLLAYGKTAKADKLAIDLRQNNAKLDVAVAEDNVINAFSTLRKILGIEEDGPLELDPLKDLTVSMIPAMPSPSDALIEALKSRSDLALTSLTFDAYNGGKLLALAPYLPFVELGMNWQWNLGEVSLLSTSVRQYFTLNVTWDFWDNGATLLDMRKAQLEARRASINHKEKTVDVRNEVDRSWRSLELAKETLRLRDAGILQAQEAYRGFESRFALGRVSTTELLFSENALNQAKHDHLSATIGIEIAYLRMQKALGKKPPLPL